MTPPPGWVAVQGTVSDASTAGFTVVTSGGTRVPVTTSGGTFVVVPHASLGQLQAGVTTVALGHAGPDGTLSAIGVLQQPPGSQCRVHFNVAVRGCSPASIAEALDAITRRSAPAADPPDPDDGWHRYPRGASHRMHG